MILFNNQCGQLTGWGHLARSLAIADQLLTCGVHSTFLIAGEAQAARTLITDHYSVQISPLTSYFDAKYTLNVARQTGASGVLLDGYQFDNAYEKILADGGLSLAVMDDYGHNPHHHAKIIINGNLHYSSLGLYKSADVNTRLLLGPSFMPLHSRFQKLRTINRLASDRVSNILLVLGSSDTAGIMHIVLDILIEGSDDSTSITVAGLPPEPGSSESNWMKRSVHIRWVRDPKELAVAMTHCDLAISAGGMTSYELAYMGVPTILVPATAHQVPVSQELAMRGAAIVSENPLVADRKLAQLITQIKNSTSQRQDMIRAGQAIFDGHGSMRIASALAELIGETSHGRSQILG